MHLGFALSDDITNAGVAFLVRIGKEIVDVAIEVIGVRAWDQFDEIAGRELDVGEDVTDVVRPTSEIFDLEKPVDGVSQDVFVNDPFEFSLEIAVTGWSCEQLWLRSQVFREGDDVEGRKLGDDR